MNCWPDGRELTLDEVIELGIEAGLIKREELPAMMATHQKMFGEKIWTRTVKLRFDMMCAGKLMLKTRIRSEEERTGKETKVDPEILDWLSSLEKGEK